eukprot:4594514-Prymnesium_polylepis.1
MRQVSASYHTVRRSEPRVNRSSKRIFASLAAFMRHQECAIRPAAVVRKKSCRRRRTSAPISVLDRRGQSTASGTSRQLASRAHQVSVNEPQPVSACDEDEYGSRLRRAEELNSSHEFGKAVRILTKAIRTDAARPEAHLELASSYELSGDIPRAIVAAGEAFDRCTKPSPMWMDAACKVLMLTLLHNLGNDSWMNHPLPWMHLGEPSWIYPVPSSLLDQTTPTAGRCEGGL